MRFRRALVENTKKINILQNKACVCESRERHKAKERVIPLENVDDIDDKTATAIIMSA